MKLDNSKNCYLGGRKLKKLTIRDSNTILYQSAVLPYTQLQWIENNDAQQWLDTGIAFDTNQMRVEMEFYGGPRTTSYAAYLGTSQDSVVWTFNDSFMVRFTSSTKIEFINRGTDGGGATLDCDVTNVNNKYKLVTQYPDEYNEGLVEIFVNDNPDSEDARYFTSSPTTAATHNKNIYLFTFNQKGSAYTSRWQKAKIASFKLWKSGDLVLDLIPCLNNETGKPCFYDTVSGTFKKNEFAGDWTPGPVA